LSIHGIDHFKTLVHVVCADQREVPKLDEHEHEDPVDAKRADRLNNPTCINGGRYLGTYARQMRLDEYTAETY
jgi:hypothetical protein